MKSLQSSLLLQNKRLEKRAQALIDKDMKVVISFDGGGIRGLISAIIAEALENAAGIPLAHACDLMIGTSTGGIVALGLTAPSQDDPNAPQYTAREIVDQFYDYGKTIFTGSFSRSIKSLWGIEKSKYGQENIQKVMTENFGDRLVSQAITRLVVTGVEIEQYMPLLFKSYAAPDLLMKDAAISTSAAPTYFPVSKIQVSSFEDEEPSAVNNKEDCFVIDGGISGVNNPALLGYSEICNIFREVEDIKENVIVISIGTGKAHRTIHYDDVAEGGDLVWTRYLVPLIMELGGEITDQQMEILLDDLPKSKGGLRRYWRLQPIVPEQSLELDTASEVKIKDLRNLARTYLREKSREIHFLGKLLATRAAYLKDKT